MAVDRTDPMWLTRAQAVAQEPELRIAPPEYLAVLPWVVDGGVQWIHGTTLTEWCDGHFVDRAAELVQQAEDEDWRGRRDRL